MEFKPLRNIVYVEIKEKELKTQTGIITKIHKSVLHDRPTEGKVIAVGPDVKNVKVNDYIYFENISGIDIDEKHLVLKEPTILGILNKG